MSKFNTRHSIPYVDLIKPVSRGKNCVIAFPRIRAGHFRSFDKILYGIK